MTIFKNAIAKLSSRLRRELSPRLRSRLHRELSPQEVKEVTFAHRLLLNGWPHFDVNQRNDPSLLEKRDMIWGLVNELNSGDSERQLAALNRPDFKAIVAAEQARNEKLKAMYYLKAIANVTELSLRTAAQVCDADCKTYTADLALDKNEDARKLVFPYISDTFLRKWTAGFCWLLTRQLATRFEAYETRELDDISIKTVLVDDAKHEFVQLPEESFHRRLEALLQMGSTALPERMRGYAAMLADAATVQEIKDAWSAAEDVRTAKNLGWIRRIEEKILIARS